MKRFRYNAGFSLVEVMVAILILGVALVGLMRGLTTALASNKDSELQTAAALIAAGQIETLRAGKIISDGTTEGDCGAELPLYQWTQTVSAGTIDGLHEVTVTVKRTNTEESIYELSTMLFDPDYPGQEGAGGKTDHRHREKRPKGRGAE